MAALLPTMAFAAEDNAPAAGATAAQSQSESSSSDNVRMFSPEWREQKILDREENLRALDEEQRRFDRWEKNARKAVGGICADCLGGGSGGTMTIPADAIPNIPSNTGFDETSAYYAAPPAPQVVGAPSAVVTAPARAPVGSAGAPLDIRSPAAR
ncbi:hypothetical protein [Pseudochelatococcus contaminans]|nr:hypothetical protein [Pseudochelatococcus contaminans]